MHSSLRLSPLLRNIATTSRHIRTHPCVPPSRSFLGSLFNKKPQPSQQQPQLQLNNKNNDFKLKQVTDHLQAGRKEEAKKTLKEIVQENPASHVAVLSLAELLLVEQKIAETLDLADKALMAAPNDPSFLTLRGSVLQQQGKLYPTFLSSLLALLFISLLSLSLSTLY
jgi:predicted Zn-dependent protease